MVLDSPANVAFEAGTAYRRMAGGWLKAVTASKLGRWFHLSGGSREGTCVQHPHAWPPTMVGENAHTTIERNERTESDEVTPKIPPTSRSAAFLTSLA